MKFLHTSDLHLGKKLDGILRLDEQKAALNEILSIGLQEKVDIVLIAGDVYDTFIPSSDAENMFFEMVDLFSQNGITVVCISGNHDDEDRLLASKLLASRRGIYLCGNENNFENREFNGVSLTRSGNNYVVFSNAKESVFIATVPYFGEAPVGYAIDKEQSFGDRAKQILGEIFANKMQNEVGVLLTHLFVLGGSRSDGERDIDLGGVKVLSPEAIPTESVYTALGHLHKRQVISAERNVVYSGSPLQYSYDEVGCEKSVTVFEIADNRVQNLHEIELKSGKRLAKISCLGIENASELLDNNLENYVDLTIISDRPLTFEETAEIKSKYSNVTKIKLELNGNFENGAVVGRKNLSEKELFVEFYKCKFGSEPDDELLSAYLEIMAEE